jgi:hypothetical protein
MLFNFALIKNISTFELTVLLVLLVWLFMAFGASYLRKRRIERKLHLQIINQGNIDTRYRLRVEEPSGAMSIFFYHDSKRLPVLSPSVVEQAAQPALAYASPGNAMEYSTSSPSKKRGTGGNFASSFSNMLTSIGTLLPASIGRPFLQAGSKIYRGQITVGHAKGKVKRTQGYIPSVPSSSSKPTAPSSQPTEVKPSTYISADWAETPVIKPGQKVKLRVLLRPAWTGEDQTFPVRLLSTAAEAPAPQVVAQESQVQVKGGFLSHALYPQLLAFVLAAAAIVALFWMRSIGYLV